MEGLKPEEIDALQAMAKKLEQEDWYGLLGLYADFTADELRKSYYDLSRRYHPDRFYRRNIEGHESLIEMVFAGINKSYNILRNPTERRKHDESLRDKPDISKPLVRPAPPEPVSADEVVMDFSRVRKGEEGKEPGKKQVAKKQEAKRPVPPHMAKLREQILQQLAKARQYHQTAQEEIKQEQWVKAASSLYLACQFDPKNEDYKRLHAEISQKASKNRVQMLIAAADNAMNYNDTKQAITHLTKAIEYDPPQGESWFRLAELLISQQQDDRGALGHYRKAAEKEPGNTKYRMALAHQYAKLGMNRNALREYQAVLERDPKNEDAKAGLKKVRV